MDTQKKPHSFIGTFGAISMVVGTVIGSGVFYKAQDIIISSNKNILIGALAWLLGGLIMLFCAISFSNISSLCKNEIGLIGFYNSLLGKGFSYYIAWFLMSIYYPSMIAIIAWSSARFSLALMGFVDKNFSIICFGLSIFYLAISFSLNTFLPTLSQKFISSATIIKLVPLVLMIIAGVFSLLFLNPNPRAIFHITEHFHPSIYFSMIVATSFAYEGWIAVTSIAPRLKNPKRTLPLALTIGSLITIFVYILFFIALMGGATVEEISRYGTTIAFENLFGRVGGGLLNIFVVISCLGALFGLTMASVQTPRTIISRGLLKNYSSLLKFSSAIEFFISLLWLILWFFKNSRPNLNIFFDSSELPVVTIYAFYIPIFIKHIKLMQGSFLNKALIPVLAIAGSLFMVVSGFVAHKKDIFFYLLFFTIVMLIGKAIKSKK